MYQLSGIIFAVVTALLLAGCDNKTTNLSTQDPDFAYELDTWAENSEVYEFTLKASPDQACIMLMLDSGVAMAMDCFPKGTAAPKVSLLSPDYMYELDTWVENSELYEFTPRSNRDYSCIMYMLDSGNDMDLKCRPKAAQMGEVAPALPTVQ
ncbi:MAG: hypothetical protein V7752_12335 [Halopseudomonas sp.]